MYFSSDSSYGIIFITNGGVFDYAANDFYNIENQVINAVYNFFLYPKKKVIDKSLKEDFEENFPPDGWAITDMNGNNSNTWTSFTTSKPSGGTTTTKTARISYTKSGILITKRVLVSDTSKILYFNFRKFW